MQIAKTLVAFFAFIQIVCAALRNVSPDGPCDPGELVFVGFCNLCLCNSQHIPNQLCAKSWCPVGTPLQPVTTNKPFKFTWKSLI